MKVLKDRHLVLVKKQEAHAPIFSTEVDKYINGRPGHIEIKPARFENIEIHLFFPASAVPPKVITIYYYDSRSAKFASKVYTLEGLDQSISKDGKTKGIRIINYCNERPSEAVSLYQNICIESIDAEDFEFQIEVHLRYTYQVHAGTFETEFSWEDGKCHHGEGDTLPYDKDTELSVMEINHDLGIVYCSATGFPR